MFQPIENKLVLVLVVIAVIAIWTGVLFGLGILRSRERKRIIIATTFLAGLFYVLEFFLPGKSPIFFWNKENTNPFTALLSPVGMATLAIGGFTYFLGVVNLIIIHGRTVARHRSGWYNSAAFFVALIAMVAFGLLEAYWTKDTSFGKLAHRTYEILFNGALISLNATMFSLLAFYITVAAYRAFRLRSGEATLLVGAAFVVMLGQVPVGSALTAFLPTEGWISNLRVENVALWLSNVISMAGLRAVNFGIGVGALAMSLRLWLNLERGAFFEQEF